MLINFIVALTDFRFISESRVSVCEGFCPPGNGGTEGGVKTIDRCEHRDRGNWQYAPVRNGKMTKRQHIITYFFDGGN